MDAGFVKGPNILKILLCAISFLGPITCFIALWWPGANIKPKPTFSMQSDTWEGFSSRETPAASNKSALPLFLVADLLPCFATLAPQAQATNAAVVETLNIPMP